MTYYLGHYICDLLSNERRWGALPTMNKMGYIISALTEITPNKAMVLSPCETGSKQLVKGQTHRLNDKIELRTFHSRNSDNRILRRCYHMMTETHLYLFLLKHVTKDDTLIVYHSLALMSIVKRIKRLKKCRLIIEVEEVYADVNEDAALRKKELKYLQIADAYIAITEMVNKAVNLQNKPRILSHGTYETIPTYGQKFPDGKIHVVYAGSFNPIKGGALTAVGAAEYLDDRYVMHILGRGGDEASSKMVFNKIAQVSEKTACQIVYNGYYTGKIFDTFIQSCHIGLSTQQPDGQYNASSFPSKILMYMSNGLPVVSVRIPAVESSQVGDYIYYYDDPTPEKIAAAIKSVPTDNFMDARDRLNELDKAFKQDLSALLKPTSES